MDFSFRWYATPRMLNFVYAIHLLAGLVAGVAWVVLCFQQAPVQGLLALIASLVAFFFLDSLLPRRSGSSLRSLLHGRGHRPRTPGPRAITMRVGRVSGTASAGTDFFPNRRFAWPPALYFSVTIPSGNLQLAAFLGVL
jgi:uncharacterized protein DUF4282